MIYLTLGGGLGNQMFQYAFAKIISLKTNQRIVLNLYHIERDKIRDMSLQNLSIEDIRVCPRIIGYLIGCKIKLTGKIAKRKEKKEDWKRKRGYYTEPEVYKYIPLMDDYLTKKNYYIEGGFQTPLYFADIRNDLIREFRISGMPETKNREMMDRIKKTNSVCLHIRRGDYLDFQNLNLCTYQYYLNAMRYISEKEADPVFFVFSTSHADIQWIRDNYDFSCYSLVYVDLDNVDYEELRLMSECRHFIMSNSTFSWWAQYLSSEKDKIVVAPNRWNTDLPDDDNIYMEDWHLIEV